MDERRRLNDEPGRLAALRRAGILDTPPEEPFERITELVRSVLGVPIATVSLVDEERQWLKSSVGLTITETPRDLSFCTHTIKTREPLIVPDARLDTRFRDFPYVIGEPGVRSYLGLPLETPDGYNLGALCAIDTVPRDFTTTEAAIMKNFSRLVMNELELRQIAMSDSLTGAMTRRGWMEAVETQIARCRRNGQASSIVLLDVDHFKRINDGHGHAAGDRILRGVAQACFANLRDADLFARIGGEEFAIFLPMTDAAHAAALAERLREQISLTPYDLDGAAVRITASFGITQVRADVEGVEAGLKIADAMLYRAKLDGRNVCRVA
ncbi:sensor domain-containing diguanylate cyclase [Pseudooceanicola sediminis]|uniref:diguanylate cyclase n=1 Tax=Pseudooceanicola sediminis TaxID=2211117 RepID=A0A399J4M9_9RHOB|nr:sensor domain-containing diguanylate cyclase [Pseudooceanicola sediminis]KAA2315501.1 sensor domain-containing diguanylate cyclase [Puniceibacterium sp. HSS470]RII40294.1 sensor domain-containing diguanylate cyclase [Pseudooceanicola sediminis]|tara:strand:+ start:104510 stop:105487 length:978 start_codon:yes stop_codon:yes gene_type:complete